VPREAILGGLDLSTTAIPQPNIPVQIEQTYSATKQAHLVSDSRQLIHGSRAGSNSKLSTEPTSQPLVNIALILRRPRYNGPTPSRIAANERMAIIAFRRPNVNQARILVTAGHSHRYQYQAIGAARLAYTRKMGTRYHSHSEPPRHTLAPLLTNGVLARIPMGPGALTVPRRFRWRRPLAAYRTGSVRLSIMRA